jgi:hypothetical protein
VIVWWVPLFVFLFGLSMDYHVFIVLPAAMTLIGDRCWYLPRWLDWLHGSSGN